MLHVDGAGVPHEGVIVGLSNDGHACYIKSTSPTAPPSEWHWTIKKSLASTLNKNYMKATATPNT